MAKRPPRQKQAAERARRRRQGRGDGLTWSGRGDVGYRSWVGSVLDRARRELGVSDSTWTQIEQACVGNIRFAFPLRQPNPAEAEVFARTAVLEEYASWLACERAVSVETDGTVRVHAEAVATLAQLPVDSFERSWAQTGQPALAIYLACCRYLEDQLPEDESAAGWLTDLHAASRGLGPCGRLAVDATIETMITDYDVGDIEDELKRSGLLAAVAGCSDRFDATYRIAEAPHPTTDDVTDLVTAVATVRAWLDAPSRGPSADLAAAQVTPNGADPAKSG